MYGKSFESMYEGSMVGIGPTTFAVWGYCITKADNVDHTVILNPVLLAAVLGTTEEDIVNSVNKLTSPDPVSKNPARDGRRLLHQTGHLYFVVSHEAYRGIKTNEDRRKYMRNYMRDKRDVNNKVNTKLTKVNPASASASASASDLKGGVGGTKKLSETEKKRVKVKENTPLMRRIGLWFGRKHETLWAIYEAEALAVLGRITDEDLAPLENYYVNFVVEKKFDPRRRDLSTLLNNWQLELDRANGWVKSQQPVRRKSLFDKPETEAINAKVV